MLNISSNNPQANSGYYSRNLESSLFLGSPKDANFNPLNLKFDKPGINNQARPKDSDILHQNPEKRGSSRHHNSTDLEFKMPRNRFEQFYHSKRRTAERVAGDENLKAKPGKALSSSQPNLRVAFAQENQNITSKLDRYYVGKELSLKKPTNQNSRQVLGVSSKSSANLSSVPQQERLQEEQKVTNGVSPKQSVHNLLSNLLTKSNIVKSAHQLSADKAMILMSNKQNTINGQKSDFYKAGSSNFFFNSNFKSSMFKLTAKRARR